MLILRSTERGDAVASSASAASSTAAALPLGVMLPALAVMSGDRLGTAATVALILAGLALIARTAGLAARDAARSERARRDEAVLDALEPLAGLRR
ncbi:hypothetical protein [Streptomyces erythrochromogenes]|uniref:hypothetical protein n=1 Tax=Streptomyces erythrochromogenes TaxID=285574 RepID=UPI0002DD8317